MSGRPPALRRSCAFVCDGEVAIGTSTVDVDGARLGGVIDIPALMDQLARTRPLFHSEADFQHALAWLIQQRYSEARVRLETRPERGIRLDLMVTVDGERCAIELKHFSDRIETTVDGEHFHLPRQSAQDISRYDFCKDIWRVEKMIADGYADSGWVVALSSDGGYWRAGTKSDPIDWAFRLHDGSILSGDRAWGQQAGHGTTKGRAEPLMLRGHYECRWVPYRTIDRAGRRPIELRYLALRIQ